MQSSPARSPVRPVSQNWSHSVPVCPPLFSPPLRPGAAEIGNKAVSQSHVSKSQHPTAVHSNSIADDGEAEEDALADSDEEEMEKDLDWHLGLLTRRQSEISQISQALSSNAALYSGNINKNSRGVNSTAMRHQPQGIPIPRADKARVTSRVEYLPTASLNQEQLHRHVESSLQVRRPQRQTHPSASSSVPSLPEVDDSQIRFSGISGQSSRKDSSMSSPNNFISSSSLCNYTESSYGFDGLSNMTMILAGKANMTSPNDNRSNQKGNLSTSLHISESMRSDLESNEREARPQVYEDSDPGGRIDSSRKGTDRGLFAAVMKQTVT